MSPLRSETAKLACSMTVMASVVVAGSTPISLSGRNGRRPDRASAVVDVAAPAPDAQLTQRDPRPERDRRQVRRVRPGLEPEQRLDQLEDRPSGPRLWSACDRVANEI